MMTRFIQWEKDELVPAQDPVFRDQGVDPAQFRIEAQQALSPRAERLDRLFRSSLDLYLDQVQPKGMWDSIGSSEFEQMYRGRLQTEKITPLQAIAPQAEHLAVFALTLGPQLSLTISQCFDKNDYARGYMLDTIASRAAEMAVDDLEKRFSGEISKPGGNTTGRLSVLAYSPGYCGWHISAQANIFSFLNPHQIGIRLNDSFLMTPLKSVTGVLVAGLPKIHRFNNDFPFCRDCGHATCRSRMERVISA